MKVRDVMQNSVLSVDEDDLVKNVARLIFSASRNIYPVVQGKKLVGVITDEDIFFAMFRASENTYNREQLIQTLEKKVKEIMVKDVIAVTPDTDLVDAHLLMYKHNFAVLPVIDNNKNLIGVITRANIFRHVLEAQVPKLEESQFMSFIAENYDEMTDWEKRFDYEFPTLFRVFKKDNVEKVLELGVWTGEYTIGLAREGVNIVGLDQNPLMISICNNKRNKLPEKIKKRVSFQESNYMNLSEKFSVGSFDAVICMGGTLPYIHVDPALLLKSIHKVVRKDGVVIFQLMNLERVIEQKRRFLYFKIKKSQRFNEKEELYVEFFDKKDDRTLIQNVVTFTSDGKRWLYRGINSVEIAYLKNDEIESFFQKAGFNNITISGNRRSEEEEYGQMSLIKPFDPRTSDWLTVFAKK